MSKLLVVDDDIGAIEMLRGHFSLRGAEVHCAQTSEEALRLAFKERPELVFLDLGLPDFPGEEVLKRIKKFLPQIRVIVVSGSQEAGIKERILKLGADAYFEKGEASFTEITGKVHELLS